MLITTGDLENHQYLTVTEVIPGQCGKTFGIRRVLHCGEQGWGRFDSHGVLTSFFRDSEIKPVKIISAGARKKDLFNKLFTE